MNHPKPTTSLDKFFFVVVISLVMGLGSPFAWGSESASSPSADPHPREKTYMKRRWGIEVEFVRQVAHGYMIEFRYKVIDPNRAAALFKREDKPVLVHAETGARMAIPAPSKIGALRNTRPPIEGKSYWMFFANPGIYIKKGDRVNIEIGKFRAENIEVE